jgi:putative Ca2+/H+ antiporter (TMEM165/GDT1 family)
MDWKIFLTTFTTLFVAELGDKTQLACVMMAAESKKPWTVFLGASLALVLVSLIGVILAQSLANWVSSFWIKKVAAVGFVFIGVLIFFDKL